jgi:hypothetical protein
MCSQPKPDVAVELTPVQYKDSTQPNLSEFLLRKISLRE